MFTKPLLLNGGGNKGSFSGTFYVRSLSTEEAYEYHSSFTYGYEWNDINDTGLFRVVVLGNQYYIAIRVYCDSSIMNLGNFTIYQNDGITTLLESDGRQLEFSDYGEGFSFYLIYAGNPRYNALESALSAATGSTLTISYEYDSNYIISGSQIKVVNVDNNVVYYTFRYAHPSKILSRVDFELQYKYITTNWNGSVTTEEWRSVASGGNTLYVDGTSCVYNANVTVNQDPSRTYAILAILAFQDNTVQDIRSNEFQLNT